MGKPMTCPGCGAELQTRDPAGWGYVPAEILSRQGASQICRRCFRLVHYADPSGPGPVPAAVWTAIRRAVNQADRVLLLADIIDFEPSLWEPLVEAAGKSPVLVVNKIDLLPPQSSDAELAQWVRDRCAPRGLSPAGVHVISARRGWGTRALWTRLAEDAREGTVAILGVTNAGKSALLARWHRAAQEPGSPPTVSPIPGTTIGIVRLRGPGGLAVLDTPGVPPPGRLGDRLCPACARQIVPDRRLNGKLLTFRSGQALLFGGLAAVAAGAPVPDKTLLIAYAAGGLALHRTRAERVEELLRSVPPPLGPVPCRACRARLFLCRGGVGGGPRPPAPPRAHNRRGGGSLPG
ncbi:MAG: 50S ribosome-binding GTPase, partial [Firmicutes bacterium]|nr:50S ribosome-binding GTPase [Bacillota bacterium]